MMKALFDFLEGNKEWGPRILAGFFGAAFLVAGLDKILSMSMAKSMFEMFFGAGLGAPMLYLAITLEILGGLALLLDWHKRETAIVMTIFMLVALWKSWMLGEATTIIGTLREMLVMNTGGGNTAVNFAYIAGLVSLAFSDCKQCK